MSPELIWGGVCVYFVRARLDSSCDLFAIPLRVHGCFSAWEWIAHERRGVLPAGAEIWNLLFVKCI